MAMDEQNSDEFARGEDEGDASARGPVPTDRPDHGDRSGDRGGDRAGDRGGDRGGDPGGDRGERSYGGRGEDRGDGRGPYRGGKGKTFFRRKVCKFCTQKVAADYKNPDALRRFVTERGKILPRRITGTCAKHQRMLAREIKRARSLAMLPFAKR